MRVMLSHVVLLSMICLCHSLLPLRFALNSFILNYRKDSRSSQLKVFDTSVFSDMVYHVTKVEPLTVPLWQRSRIVDDDFTNILRNITKSISSGRTQYSLARERDNDRVYLHLLPPQDLHHYLVKHLPLMSSGLFFETLSDIHVHNDKLPSDLRLMIIQLINGHLHSMDSSRVSPIKVLRVIRSCRMTWSDLDDTSKTSFSKGLSASLHNSSQPVAIVVFGLSRMNGTWVTLDPGLRSAVMTAVQKETHSLYSFLDSVIFSFGVLRVPWVSVSPELKSLLQKGLVKRLRNAEPSTVMRILTGLSSMNAKYTQLDKGLTAALMQAASAKCRHLDAYGGKCFYSLSDMRFPRSVISPNVGALIDSAALLSLQKGTGFVLNRLMLMNTTVAALSTPLQKYLRCDSLKLALAMDSSKFAQTIRCLGMLKLSWGGLSSDTKTNLIRGLEKLIMAFNNRNADDPVNYSALRFISLRGLVLMKPNYDLLPTALQAGYLEHAMILLEKRSLSKMAFGLNYMASAGIKYVSLPRVTQECIMNSLAARLPLLNPRRLAVCLISMARLGIVHTDLSQDLQLKISNALLEHKEELMRQEIRHSLAQFLKMIFHGVIIT